MAHLIDLSNGRANMAFVGEKPWHGLGQELSEGASIDQWRVEAGLDWTVQRAQVYFKDTDERFRKGTSEILYRDDTYGQLGIVTDRYKIVQPSTVLEFFRDIVDAGHMKLETAGSLDDGKKVWALAKTGDSFSLFGQDRLEGYLLLSTSFDGSMATRAQFTSVRVVCNNTLQLSNREAKGAIKIPHSTDFNADGVKIDLGILGSTFTQFETQAADLARVTLDRRQAMDLLLSIMEPKLHADIQSGKVDPKDSALSTKRNNQILTIFDLYQGKGMGSGFRSSQSTAWGLVNAVTEYVDHQQGNSTNNRFRSAQFGPGAILKDLAFQTALKLVA
jgi:phage/plasmid-like protein (TIGR03299 family)